MMVVLDVVNVLDAGRVASNFDAAAAEAGGESEDGRADSVASGGSGPCRE